MSDEILRRIDKQTGVADLYELLTQLPITDLNSLLLKVYKIKVGEMSATDLMAATTATAACDLDIRLLRALEDSAFKQAETFEAVELSPICPLGTISVLGNLDQAKVLSTLRSYEVASDPTCSMTLECARRRRQPLRRKEWMRLCTSQRILRFPLPTVPGYTAHFKLFSLVTAGRNIGSSDFALNAMKEHIDVYLRLLKSMPGQFAFGSMQVKLCEPLAIKELTRVVGITESDIRTKVRSSDSQSGPGLLDKHGAEWPRLVSDPVSELSGWNLSKEALSKLSVLNEILQELQSMHPEVSFKIDLQRLTGIGYYCGPCFHIGVQDLSGQWSMIADGGACDWTQRLLGDRKERLMTSAIGIELLCRRFAVK